MNLVHMPPPDQSDGRSALGIGHDRQPVAASACYMRMDSSMQTNRVGILGGSGFVGRHIAGRLAHQGVECRILTRHPHRHRDLMLIPGSEVRQVNVFAPRALQQALKGCDAVINLVGILNQSAKGGFRRAHVELVDVLVDACREAEIRRLLHMSALNADESKGSSEYLRSKGEGENRAHTRGQASIHVTSFRPSVIFGPGDSFFNRFADLLPLAQGVFPLACPNSRFAPVYVGDVADAFARSLDDPDSFARRYELCGPRAFSLRELVAYTAEHLELSTRILGLSDGLSRMQARVLGLLPGKPFTMDNYLSLQTDSVCRDNGLEALGIEPTDIEAVVPLYLGNRSLRRRYFALRRPA